MQRWVSCICFLYLWLLFPTSHSLNPSSSPTPTFTDLFLPWIVQTPPVRLPANLLWDSGEHTISHITCVQKWRGRGWVRGAVLLCDRGRNVSASLTGTSLQPQTSPEELSCHCQLLGREGPKGHWVRHYSVLDNQSSRWAAVRGHPAVWKQEQKGAEPSGVTSMFHFALWNTSQGHPCIWVSHTHFQDLLLWHPFLDKASCWSFKRSTLSSSPSEHEVHCNVKLCFLVCVSIKLSGLLIRRGDKNILLISYSQCKFSAGYRAEYLC